MSSSSSERAGESQERDSNLQHGDVVLERVGVESFAVDEADDAADLLEAGRVIELVLAGHDAPVQQIFASPVTVESALQWSSAATNTKGNPLDAGGGGDDPVGVVDDAAATVDETDQPSPLDADGEVELVGLREGAADDFAAADGGGRNGRRNGHQGDEGQP